MSAREHRWNTGKYPHALTWQQQSDNEQMLLEIMGSEAKWLWVISLPRGIDYEQAVIDKLAELQPVDLAVEEAQAEETARAELYGSGDDVQFLNQS